MKRSKHNLSHYRLTTMDMGQLIPVACVEALPGDTFQGNTSALIRVSPLVAPVMHPVTVRIHHWFVPNRLLWSGWEDFITGGPDGIGGSSGPFPVIRTPPTTGFVEGELGDYLGVPPGVPDVDVSALPFRAYNMIWNEFYRDQDLAPEVALDSTVFQQIAWEKDYFTSCRPWPQKGPDVSLPLGTAAPVRSNAIVRRTDDLSQGTLQMHGGVTNDVLGAGGDTIGATVSVDLLGTADLTNATATNVNAVRRAFALQRYAEARAQYGSRYTEYLRYLGVRPSDARLQRPEYLGGGKQTIAFSEVLKTGAGEDPAEAIGTMKGHGIAALRSNRYRRFFEEHGYVISCLSVRPKTMYTQGLHKHWLRRTKEEFYQRELEQIGQQPVADYEIYAGGSGAVFGYQDRYAEYKHVPSTVHGEFRSLLDYWHMARNFGTPPVLNEAFITCDPTKRIHAVETNHVLWCMINNQIRARRMVRKSSSSRIY